MCGYSPSVARLKGPGRQHASFLTLLDCSSIPTCGKAPGPVGSYETMGEVLNSSLPTDHPEVAGPHAVTAPPTVGAVLLAIVSHPRHYLIAHWNWKSALTSAIIRGLLFFFTNLSAGFSAASWALLLQFVYRAATSGFWGSFTQALRTARPHWLAVLTVGVGLTSFAHILEFLVAWLGGTAELKRSILVSVGFTVISNLFNLYVMQRNALVVGKHGDSLWTDMVRMPGLIAGFVAWPFQAVFRRLRARIPH